jgi:cell wall-associated NlpC family hydrolase
VRRFPRVSIAVALLLMLVAPRAAWADPVADKQAEAARIARQLQADGERLSQLAEQYNQARIKSDASTQKAAAAKAELARSDALLAHAAARVKAQAVEAYIRGGGAAASSLAGRATTGDPSRRDEYVAAVVGAQRDAIDALRQVRQEVEARQAAASSARLAANQALARVNASKAAAEGVQRSEQATLRGVQGELSTLVAAETKRQADADAARAQAALAARQKKAATATTAAPKPGSPTPTTLTGTTPTTRRPTTPTTEPTGPPPPANSGAGAAVQKAKEQLGKPYQYGGSGPDSYDCSGLTMVAWKAGGVSLPHSAEAQYSATTRVATSALQPGDLLFYGSPIHHVGIYVGGGQMIEAPQTGDVVRYASIYRSDLVGAGRP